MDTEVLLNTLAPCRTHHGGAVWAGRRVCAGFALLLLTDLALSGGALPPAATGVALAAALLLITRSPSKLVTVDAAVVAVSAAATGSDAGDVVGYVVVQVAGEIETLGGPHLADGLAPLLSRARPHRRRAHPVSSPGRT